MDHKTFLSTLSPTQRETLTARSDVKGIMHLVGHWGAIVLCSSLIVQSAPVWQLVLIVQGVLLVFLFTLLHETSHKTPFRSGWINDVVGHVCGFLLLLPATWFRYFHFAHHRFTQIPGKDPELEAPKPTTWAQYISHISGIPVWISHIKTLLRNALGQQQYAYVPKARVNQITKEARVYLLGYAILFSVSVWQSTPVLFFVWLLPMLLGQPFLRLYLLAEHGRCPAVVDMFKNTRTTFTNRLVRAIAWNMPYHTEHHSYPSVPFHRLPDLHRLIEPHLSVTASSYTAFNKDYILESVKSSKS
ncbi:fatty acid desaturase [Parasedimentitalea marina]|uniref:Fatty acid desaturase n=1 Tax=Parasedimentitalea marina TaxID=2483033 RepID=A0A3T0N8W3_9RHOB|nr:fatty acid desaturase [Parasedimentitalea marina]AZV80395.1 fatty acid desaturase [Parasedimentitalea marina]